MKIKLTLRGKKKQTKKAKKKKTTTKNTRSELTIEVEFFLGRYHSAPLDCGVCMCACVDVCAHFQSANLLSICVLSER